MGEPRDQAIPSLTDHTDAGLAGALMRRQAALSIRVAAVFLVLVLGLPLLNYFKPEWGQQAILGFPLSWFLLGILFYPITWVLSACFVKASEQLEAEDAELVRAERRR